MQFLHEEEVAQSNPFRMLDQMGSVIAPHFRFLSLLVALLFFYGSKAFRHCYGWKKKGESAF
ncbi:hypothetical protein ACOIWI_002944 [Vibrio vulnificus]|nr:hypothetical protein [Vibrio fluvialis]